MRTEDGLPPVAEPVVRGRHRALQPQGRRGKKPRGQWSLVSSLKKGVVTAPAEAQVSPRSTSNRAQPAPDFAEETAAPTECRADQVSVSPGAKHLDASFVGVRESGMIECVVAEGETVADIAGRYGVSTASVLALNGISWRTPIDVGSVIVIRPIERVAAAISTNDAMQHHPVVVGDTISAIAAGHGIPTAAVLLANGLSRGSILVPGQQLVIPRTSFQGQSRTGQSRTGARGAAPTSTGEAIALTAEMRGNASIIVSAGRSMGVAEDGLIAALAASMQDSALRNLDFDGRDAAGLFHRRPGAGWGEPEEILDPGHAARAFFGGPGSPVRRSALGLLDVPGWQLMSVGEAAAIVQEAGTAAAYAKWEQCAREWLRGLNTAS